MGMQTIPSFSYTIKARELPLLRLIEPACPRPTKVEWIDRGTNCRLRATTINQLLRTLPTQSKSTSIQKLHDSAGLRSIFSSENQRVDFAHHFQKARTKDEDERTRIVTGIFDSIGGASQAMSALIEVGVPATALYLVQDAGQLDENFLTLPRGHGKLQIAGMTASGGLLGMALGAAVLTVSGGGILAAGGLITASAFSTVPAIGGLIGATGSAIAKMVSDFDVDGTVLAYFDRQVRRGAVLLSVNLSDCGLAKVELEQFMIALGARMPVHA